MADKCANCDQIIGNLETPYLWQEKIVCKKCHGKLTANPVRVIAVPPPQPVPYATPAQYAPPIQYQQAPPVIMQFMPAAPQGKGTSVLGIVGLIFGSIALATCWVPIMGMISIPLAVIGLILAAIGLIVSLTGQQSRAGLPIVAGGICIVAIFIPILIIGSAVAAIAAAAPPPTTTSRQTPSQSPTPAQGVRGAGYEIARKAIPRALKAPATADFPWDTVTYSRLGTARDRSGATATLWTVTGAVDSDNSFGAKIRGNWEITVMEMGDKLSGLRGTLDGVTVFELDAYKSLTIEQSTH